MKTVSFFDIFNSIINMNPTLSDIQKFQYLKSSIFMTGNASNVIKSLELTNQNYQIAWNLLR